MYVIIGATGNIGKVIAETLLAQQTKVRVIGRDPNRLRSLTDRGAEARTGSVRDPAFLKSAFEGATAVFAMIPPNYQASNVRKEQDETGEAIASALQASGVSHVVNLSSVGAELEAGTGPIAGLHQQELRLNRLKSNVLHLRPTYFMENLMQNIPLIRHMGINGSALRGDLPMPMIATRDIGAAAAARLLKLDFKGHTEALLLGPANLTLTDATRVLGAAIGKPELQYVQFGYEDAVKGMMQAGLSADVARSFVEMSRAMNDGKIFHYERTPENTTPTTIEQFSKVFAAAYQSA